MLTANQLWLAHHFPGTSGGSLDVLLAARTWRISDQNSDRTYQFGGKIIPRFERCNPLGFFVIVLWWSSQDKPFIFLGHQRRSHSNSKATSKHHQSCIRCSLSTAWFISGPVTTGYKPPAQPTDHPSAGGPNCPNRSTHQADNKRGDNPKPFLGMIHNSVVYVEMFTDEFWVTLLLIHPGFYRYCQLLYQVHAIDLSIFRKSIH